MDTGRSLSLGRAQRGPVGRHDGADSEFNAANFWFSTPDHESRYADGGPRDPEKIPEEQRELAGEAVERYLFERRRFHRDEAHRKRLSPLGRAKDPTVKL